jgi:hypothetical protein
MSGFDCDKYHKEMIIKGLGDKATNRIVVNFDYECPKNCLSDAYKKCLILPISERFGKAVSTDLLHEASHH